MEAIAVGVRPSRDLDGVDALGEPGGVVGSVVDERDLGDVACLLGDDLAVLVEHLDADVGALQELAGEEAAADLECRARGSVAADVETELPRASSQRSLCPCAT